jgi:hypothetical protein
MAKQAIGRGATANDGTGDNLRAGALKINENFDEIYTALGDGSVLTVATVAKTGAYSDLSGRPTLGTAAAQDVGAFATAAQGTDSREWTATTVSQAEAEAGTATTRRAWTAERVAQAIVARFAALTSVITATKATPVDADQLPIFDIDLPKLTTVGGLRAALVNTQTVGTGLATTGTVNLDLAALTGTFQTITATGNLTFTASNYSAGRRLTLCIEAGGSARTLAWPSGWVRMGAALPTSLASGAVIVVTLLVRSTTEASTIVTHQVSV